MSRREIVLAATAFNKSQLLLDGKPMIILVGRSNVGKSTLLNSICGRRRQLARTSGKPGKTLSVNYYLVNDSFYLVDLPGYGYARISQTEKRRVADLMNAFFRNSSGIKLVLLLVDIRLGPGELDLLFLEQIAPFKLPLLTILTKSDKISFSKSRHQITLLKEKFNLLSLTFSSKRVPDREMIWEQINSVLQES